MTKLIPHRVINATVAGDTPIKAWREYLRMTQDEMAFRLGVSRETYVRVECDANPRKTTLRSVAEAMGIALEQLDL